VSIALSKKLIEMWEEGGSVATGCLLTISKEDRHKLHKSMLKRIGFLAVKSSKYSLEDQKRMDNFDRIWKIQDEMIKLAHEAQWM
jgi:hypothetical protein